MTRFRQDLDRAIEREKQQEAHRHQQAIERRRIECERSQSEEVLEKSAVSAWKPILATMGQLAIESADYLVESHASPNSTIHVVRRKREAGFFIAEKTFTTPMPSWIISKQTSTHSDGDGYQMRSWEETKGKAMGVDGNLYRFSDCLVWFKNRKFCSEGPLNNSADMPSANVQELLVSFPESSSAYVDTHKPSETETEQMIEAWKGALSNFVVKTVMNQ
ncbi:hypothetical protein A2917_01775 [Candidatus Nomurabacteria bacterium RIFCSPLOWO2_01_FULL_42_17]|uniref:Uncharacterized protein n=1 Tax=Candidatus Nomurabacteria bacterium RIFCSPLOWO2_01_FULL_42_17 TaxID=1801780 RepID=A0A1F6XM49_9BACT|nr:MAG: hypothetical protein A2917_01775 [Candidatus Nomurabacteria bacterium RIFCSPLOWO2_01_FULL_42_17]